jgi:uroporphyrinogen-III synthase
VAIYLLSPTPHPDAISLPLLTFSLTTSRVELEGVDYLLFTSKQAVKAMEAIEPRWKAFGCIVIGAQTANVVKELGGEVVYVASSAYGEVLAQEIYREFQDATILYVRPQEVSTDIKAVLEVEGFKIREEVIYKTECQHYSQKSAPSHSAIVIFTSPSTVRCFLENFGWHSSYKAVAIGAKTAQHFPQTFASMVAKEPTIDAAVEKAKEIEYSTHL